MTVSNLGITTLGEELRVRRISQNLSLRETARLAKISAPHLSDIELGRRNPSEKVYKTLGKILKLPYDPGYLRYQLAKVQISRILAGLPKPEQAGILQSLLSQLP